MRLRERSGGFVNKNSVREEAEMVAQIKIARPFFSRLLVIGQLPRGER